MNIKIKIWMIPVLLIVAAGCKKSFNDLSLNENKPTSVQASLLLNGVLNDLYEAPYSDYEKWDQYYIINYDYYGNNRYDFGSGADYYNTLKNVVKMDEEATNVGLPSGNVYNALAKFFKAYFFTKMSLMMGDIPMTQALQGTANLTPTYDLQKDVFKQAFAWLDSANTQLGALITAGDNNLKGDIYFGNDELKWQKTVNALRLRLLINLSKKADDPELNIKQQFAEIISNPDKYPLMEDMTDNLQYNYVYPTNNYPNNPGNFGFDALRYNASGTYVGLLTHLQDPRVFVTMEPATALVAGGKSPISFDAFVGANPGEDLGIMYNKTNAGQYSLINRHHYYDSYTGEPSIQIGYPEQCLNIAEAISRGWINGDAEAYYKLGIQHSWAFYNIPSTGSFTAYFLKQGASLGNYDTYKVDVNFENYYNQTTVKYAGNNEQGLTEILQQKYIALFRHSAIPLHEYPILNSQAWLPGNVRAAWVKKLPLQSFYNVLKINLRITMDLCATLPVAPQAASFAICI